MTSEIRIIINPETGDVSRVQISAPDKDKESQAYNAYQVIREEILNFSEQTTKLIRLQQGLSLLKSLD